MKSALERESKNARDQILWFQKIPYIQEGLILEIPMGRDPQKATFKG